MTNGSEFSCTSKVVDTSSGPFSSEVLLFEETESALGTLITSFCTLVLEIVSFSCLVLWTAEVSSKSSTSKLSLGVRSVLDMLFPGELWDGLVEVVAWKGLSELSV